MRVTQGIARSLAVAGVALVAGEAARLAVALAVCPRHAAAVAQSRGEHPVVLDAGYRLARPGEWILTCTTTHAFAGVALHEDLDCYCAPEGSDPAAIGRALGGTCEVARVGPTRQDDWGACRHAHCADDDPATFALTGGPASLPPPPRD